MVLGKNKSLLPLFVVLFPCLNGCGLTGDLVDWKGDAGLEQYAQERDKMLAQLDQYIGKEPAEIRKAFGNPAEISPPAPYEKKKYDEMWHYKVEKGMPVLFPNQYFVRFYFIDGKVAEIEVN